MKKIFGTISICLTLLALIFGAPGTTATYAAAASADPLTSQKTSPEGLLSPDGTLNLNDGFHGTLDLADWNVQIDPLRGPVFSPAALAAPDQWANLGESQDGSLNGNVNAVTISGTDIYVGGNFTNADNNAAIDYIAKWNGTSWSALGSNGAGNGSLSSSVNAIAVSGTDVYVGGVFTDVNNNGTSLPVADRIAKWDGSNWSALGSDGAGNGSFTSAVSAIAVSGTDIYVGGNFTNINNNGISLPAADRIAKWDGANWSALGSNGVGDGSLNGNVNAIAVSGTDVYVGGGFTNVNNNGTSLPTADYIVKWDGANWSALSSDGAGNGSLTGTVNAIAVSGTDVYVGGVFTDVNNNGTSLPTADYISKWDTLTGNWSALGSDGAGNGSLNGYASGVNAIAVSGMDVYVGGTFGYSGNVNNNGTSLPTADYIVKWDGANWSALSSNGAGNGSFTSAVSAIAVSGTDIYVGGIFTDVNNNGTILIAADYIAKWDGNAWLALGTGGLNGSLNTMVAAIAVSGTDVYVGGDFWDVNNNGTMDYIAKWDGSNWSALGSDGAGNGSLNSYIRAIAVSGTDLYVGGNFTNVNNNGVILPTADYIAKWDTLTGNWSALGSNGAGNGSLNSAVSAIAVSGTDVYVGGFFANINNNGTILTTADKIAKWDTLTGNWSALGSNGADNGSINDQVYDIAVSGTDVYVGGVFTNVNNNGTSLPTAAYIAKWDTLTGNWSALGSNGAGNGSLNNYVATIAVSGANVYVGGNFTNVNNNGTSLLAADYIAKWDTLTGNWSALGSNGAGNGSLSAAVSAIAVSGMDVYVGGGFTNVNTNGTSLPAADYIGKWDTLTNNWSALGSNGAGNGSLSAAVSAIAVSGTDLYVGGGFTNVNNNGTNLLAADCIAAYGIVAAATPTPTATATTTASNTPVPPTATATGSSTPIPPTATATGSSTPVPPTATATGSNTPIPPTATSTATNTPVPLTATITKTSTVTATKTATATATAVILTQILKSIAAEDGWILESSENSGAGGTMNNSASTFRLGDEAGNQQYRSILSFNTGVLPDTAVIKSAVLKIKQNGLAVGTNPFTVLGSVWVDMRSGLFGTGAIELSDFNAPATVTAVNAFNSTPVSTYYTLTLGVTGRNAINTLGRTQFRLRFGIDDNNNLTADTMKFLTGEFAGGEPQLTITYIIP